MKQTWSLNDIPWDRFDATKINPDLLEIAKAAALVEVRADEYTAYLCNVFHDDAEFQQASREWAVEEVQHGHALGRWAEMADPSWSFDRSLAIFREHHIIPTEAGESVRGSRTGELVARCMVETGTSSYYSALGDSCDEPVLKEICYKIAADEHRHYKLFYQHLKRWLDREQMGKLQRLKIALSRIVETEDDELAYAYWACHASDQPYDRKKFATAYLSRAYSFYRMRHMDRAVGMIFKACGLSPQTRMFRVAQKIAWWLTETRARQLARMAQQHRAAQHKLAA